MSPNLPSQTAHRLALPCLGLSVQLGIFGLLSALLYLFVDYPFFTVALGEPVGSSNAYSLKRSRRAAQLHLGKRRSSKEVTKPYEGLWQSPLAVKGNPLERLPVFHARLHTLSQHSAGSRDAP